MSGAIRIQQPLLIKHMGIYLELRKTNLDIFNKDIKKAVLQGNLNQVIQQSTKTNGAAGRIRTGTISLPEDLSPPRLPIPSQRHVN